MNPEIASHYFVEPLNETHDRASFCCGVQPLDRYLREQAGQDARRRITVPFVLVHRPTVKLAGFFTLANTAIVCSQLPPALAKRLPKYPLVPATLLGRLAVDLTHRGRGLGEFLLLEALRRSLDASRRIASFAVVVQAKDDSAVAFYRLYGFLPFVDERHRLFLPMRLIEELFAPP